MSSASIYFNGILISLEWPIMSLGDEYNLHLSSHTETPLEGARLAHYPWRKGRVPRKGREEEEQGPTVGTAGNLSAWT